MNTNINQRRVQRTGGSTYTISLPKNWAVDNKITAGSILTFYPEGSSIILTTENNSERSEGSVKISKMDKGEIIRSIFSMYVSGFEVIKLESGQITVDQRRTIRDATRQLVGVEIVEETAGYIKLQDLLDNSEMPIRGTVERMQSMVLSMLSDAMASVIKNDIELAEDVIERDNDVDRLWFVVSRAFRTSLMSPTKMQDLGMGRLDCFDYHTCAEQLERIGDHAVKISYMKKELDVIPEDLSEDLERLYGLSKEIIVLSIEAMLTEDKDKGGEMANEARTRVAEIEGMMLGMVNSMIDFIDSKMLSPIDAQKIGLIADSISRCADYGGNIAETVLQKNSPRPEF